MTPENIMTLGFGAIKVGLLLTSPLLLAALITGLLVSILQATTQINEMTLTFIPKILVMILVMIVAGPWMLNQILDYIHTLYSSIPEMIG